jgi:hypothetical protein
MMHASSVPNSACNLQDMLPSQVGAWSRGSGEGSRRVLFPVLLPHAGTSQGHLWGHTTTRSVCQSHSRLAHTKGGGLHKLSRYVLCQHYSFRLPTSPSRRVDGAVETQAATLPAQRHVSVGEYGKSSNGLSGGDGGKLRRNCRAGMQLTRLFCHGQGEPESITAAHRTAPLWASPAMAAAVPDSAECNANGFLASSTPSDASQAWSPFFVWNLLAPLQAWRQLLRRRPTKPGNFALNHP